jgi:hypothetical protein
MPEINEVTLTEPTAGQMEVSLREPSQTTANIVLFASIAKIAPVEEVTRGGR